MKLLEDVPSAVAHRPPPRRTKLTLGVAAAFLLVAAVVGVMLVASSGGSGDSATDGEPRPSGTIADWAAGVTDACTTVAAEQPIMAQGPEVRLDVANLAAVETGTRALVAAVHDVPLPADEAERAQANAAVAVGDQAAQAWTTLTDSSAEATPEQVAQAAELTAGFVAGMTQLGANCAPIG
ncbi:hypothetical protein [Jiangella rhizosphaerae]|uniref:Uncharacterized protein n=1 Tax=Jiangella rhizosphaerae TaxID=2293569 RepID=A0A418KQM7_9ACTN|nr:hypothetical protein [Jiangella rhizosphaerae]RIQ22323.1 hypothetical protein DY240_13920 [Jiangella rhizosphaerae]